MRWIRTENLNTDPDLAAVFPIRPHDLDAIAESMTERGYDQAEPIVAWESEAVVVDGHTRLAAAKQAGLDRVYVDERPFEDKRDALEYAIRRQRDRRNLTRQELAGFVARAVETLDRVKPSGQRSDLAQDCARSAGKSSAETAERVGVSARTVEMTRTVLASDDEETKAQLRAGQTTVNGAYKAVRQAESARLDSAAPEPLLLSVQPAFGASEAPEIRSTYSAAEWQMLTAEAKAGVVELAPHSDAGRQAKFNQVNENIDWAKWSWNPVTGCLHNCDYCYARDIAERFFAQKFVPSFLPSRLHAPRNTRVPDAAADQIGWRNVFTCSMADLFGKWVPQEWIDAVFDEVRGSPQWNFLFLTKFPRRLAELDWPDNAWCGASVDRQHRVADTEAAFRGVKAGVKWLSCEPMLERLTFTSLEMFDWVVIGAASKSTQTPEFQPPWEWVEHLLSQARAAGCRVYIKPNLRSRPQEYPGEMAR
jgi:protein gp37/ParB-like chromosome segregation protein Spo0J